jgi:hypothetical protein
VGIFVALAVRDAAMSMPGWKISSRTDDTCTVQIKPPDRPRFVILNAVKDPSGQPSAGALMDPSHGSG